jgi:hypothetical protein
MASPRTDNTPNPGPDLDVLFALHRSNGAIPLAATVDGHHRDWQYFGALDTRQRLLPAVAERVQKAMATNGFAAANTMRRISTKPRWRLARKLSPEAVVFDAVTAGQLAKDYPNAEALFATPVPVSPVTGLALAPRRARNVVAFPAAFVDLDAYRMNVPVGLAVGQLIQLAKEGQLPKPTMIVYSGRGCWPLWWLRDENGNAPRRTSETTRLFLRTQRALLLRLTWLGADPQSSFDLARLLPFPGTIREATGESVDWVLLGKPKGYRLEDLAAQLGVESLVGHVKSLSRGRPELPAAPRPYRRPRRDVDAVKQSAGKAGWRARWQRTLRELDALIAFRGCGFVEGSRNRGALYLAYAAKHAGLPADEVERRILTFASFCRPPLSASEIRGALKQARKPRTFVDAYGRPRVLSYARLWADLGVTPEEGLVLETYAPPSREPQRRTTTERREAIRCLVAERRTVPSTYAMTTLLKARGFLTTRQTTSTDYAFLNLRPTSSRPGRPRKLFL